MKVHAGDGSSEAGGGAVCVIAEVVDDDDDSFLTLSSMGMSCIIIDAPDSS
jgi:hypothetical protein